jgi:hypothetical protein
MNFRTFDRSKRGFAFPMKRLNDPAGWAPQALTNVSDWSYRLTEDDVAEVLEATARAKRAGIQPAQLKQADFPLERFAQVLADVRRELIDGRGIVMMQGFPTDRMDRLECAIAYLGMGAHLGERKCQNREGHVLGHVKDLGADFADPLVRGYKTRAALHFHTDNCDYVGLLCLNTARSGGESLVASSVTVYNAMLERSPELVEALLGDFYRSRHGEMNPGELPYYTQPMFSFHEGYFSAVGAGTFIDKAQLLPGVPKLTPLEAEAIRRYRETARECAAEIPFLPGDIQLLNNWVTLHARREYEDWPDRDRRRHLLRLWLDDPTARPLLPELRSGLPGQGYVIDGVEPNAPLDVSDVELA